LAEKPPVDWEAIERDYRAGMMTLRQVGEIHGVTHGAINKRAKRDGWDRDLSAKIKAKADSLVSKQGVSKEVSKEELDTEKAIINANAQAITDIILSHRTGIRKLRGIAEQLMNRLEDEDSGIEFPGKVSATKTLSETLKNLVGLERQAFNIDGARDPFDDKPVESIPLQEVARRNMFILAAAIHAKEQAHAAG